MKTNSPFLSVPFIVSLVALLWPTVSPAVPRSATFFPDSARVTEVTRVVPQPAERGTLKARLSLPGQAVPDSLSVRVDPASGLAILDQSLRQVSRTDEGRAADLQRLLSQSKAERVGLLSDVQALDAKIQFWQAQAKATLKSPGEAPELASQIGRNVKRDFQEKLTLEPDMEKLDKKIREYQEELSRIAGTKETTWEVSLTLSGSAVREVELTLVYTLNGCGWQPFYRLDAHPGQGEIVFDWDAEIWQSSGLDWDEIDTELATLQPHSAVAPSDLPPWIIRPRPEYRARGSQKDDAAAREAAPRLMMAALGGVEPREARQSTFALWTLGKRSIPAGTRHRLKIREARWPAEFVHLLRPSLNSEAFVRARISLPEGTEIPAGQATFLIDGASLGKRPFAFSGQDGTFFFGGDPLVTCRSLLRSRKSGETGLIVDRQTQEWSWQLDVVNGGSSAVRVRIEEPLPQPRDQRIKIEIRTEPEALREDNVMVWTMDLASGQKRRVSSTVQLEAPKEMDLDLGWRR